MKYYLSDDVLSNFQFEVYGKKGTEVTVISEMAPHINTVIVKDNLGNRFPCSVSVLSVEKVNASPVKSNPEPVNEKRGRKKAANQSLFK